MPNSHSPRNQGPEDSLNRVENRRDPKESSDLVGRTADPESALIMSDDATVISNRRNHRAGGSTSTTEIGRFLEGRDLGPYQLEKFVGGGGMGAVFRALDTTLDRIVAVKVLSPQQSGDDEMLRRFKNEAQSAARLDHENIGRVYAVGYDDGWHFIVFEFIEGTNLRDLVQKEGPFDVPRAIEASIQIADALAHASQRSVVHRDIKPSNIIITPTGRARLVDMGLARLHQVSDDQDLTMSGVTLGTFDYISPEQARDPRSADVRSDLYSLGCTIYSMLIGRPPFANGTMVQKLLQHQQETAPPLDSIRSDVPHSLSEVVARLMAKNPNDRYQRAEELVTALLEIADSLGIEITISRPLAATPVVASVFSIHNALPWLVPLMALGTLVGGLWWFSEPQPGAGKTESGDVSGSQGEVIEDASDKKAQTFRRVVDAPDGPQEYSSISQAVEAAADGDVIELAWSGVRDEVPFTIRGKNLLLNRAVGSRPVVKFSGGASESTPHGYAGIMLHNAGLAAKGVTFDLDVTSLRMHTQRHMFVLVGESSLELEKCRLTIPSIDLRDDRSPDGRSGFVLMARPSAVSDAPRVPDVSLMPVKLQVVDSIVSGAGLFLETQRSDVDLIWDGGVFVSPHRFILADGETRGAVADNATIRLSLSNASFVCEDGFACLLDSPTRPMPGRLRVLADTCRFVITAPNALVEQSGISDPVAYRSLIDWQNVGSNYEGSSIFRRIDGAAERIEFDYAASQQPFRHTTFPGDLPDLSTLLDEDVR